MVEHGALAWRSRIPAHPDTFPPSPEQPASQANTCQHGFHLPRPPAVTENSCNHSVQSKNLSLEPKDFTLHIHRTDPMVKQLPGIDRQKRQGRLLMSCHV